MGHPVTFYTSYQLYALLTSPQFVLTMARRTGYEVILSAPELTVQRCGTVNPATTTHLCSCNFVIRDAHGGHHYARGAIIGHLQVVRGSSYLAATVDRVLRECKQCAHYNVRKTFSAPISHIPTADGPFRHLMIDYVDMTQRIGRLRYILVVICWFSRWVEAVPTAGPYSRSVAKFLCREVFPRFEYQLPNIFVTA